MTVGGLQQRENVGRKHVDDYVVVPLVELLQPELLLVGEEAKDLELRGT